MVRRVIKIRKAGFILLSTILFSLISSLYYPVSAGAAQYPAVSADAAILMDVKTGQILFSKNALKQRPPASTTKVMTAILAIETCRLDDLVTVSRMAARTEGSSMYLKEGEKLTVQNLLYGALLNSGNDACVALAEHIAGSTEKFAQLMNTKAIALGAVHTNFVNPNGLPNELHYTTAYDLALIGRYALANATFAEIVSTKDTTLDLPGNSGNRTLQNTNQLLWRYLWADGVKTGTTSAAGQCLVSSASKDNRQLIAVVLRSGNRWADSVRLFEYGFGNFEYAQVAVTGAEFTSLQIRNSRQDKVPLAFGSDLGLLIPENRPEALTKKVVLEQSPEAPVRKGQVLGLMSYYVDERLAGQVTLVAAADAPLQSFWDRFISRLTSRLRGLLTKGNKNGPS